MTLNTNKEYNLLLRDIICSKTFSQEIINLEKINKKKWFELESNTRDKFILSRLQKLSKVISYTNFYKNVDTIEFKSLTDYSNTIPLLTRKQFIDYMNPLKNLGFPFKSFSDDWFSMTSGGSTTGTPTISLFSPVDTLSLSLETARNWIYLMNKFKINNFWDTYPFQKLGLQASVWGENNFNYLTGKALNLNHAFGILTGFTPELINGTAYSVQKQIELLTESVKNNKDAQKNLNKIKYITYGAEFMSKSTKEKIKEIIPNVKFLSRYGASQAYGTIAFNLPELEPNEHMVMSNIVYLEVIDENENVINDNQIGEIVLSSLHSYEQPILRFKLGDLGSIRLDSNGRQIVKLIGRNDGIVIFNSQKIPTSVIIEEALNLLKHKFNLTGEGQIRKSIDGNYTVYIVAKDITKQILINNKIFEQRLKDKIFKAAIKLGLPAKRAIEGYNIKIVIIEESSLTRSGLSNKIRPYIDESA